MKLPLCCLPVESGSLVNRTTGAMGMNWEKTAPGSSMKGCGMISSVKIS